MPKYPGIHSKILKSGTVKYYGSKWKGKTYTTSLYPTAQEAYEALRVLIKELQSGIRLDKKHITVEQFIRLYIKKYIEPKQIQPISKRVTISRFSIGLFYVSVKGCIRKKDKCGQVQNIYGNGSTDDLYIRHTNRSL